MDFLSMLNPVAKWLHIIAGVMWIGLLYFFNFINGHVVATMDADTKSKVVPELMPRALYWFRWGAAWTWFTGVILLFVIFWSQGSLSMDATSETSMMVEGEGIVTMWTHILLLVTFLSVFVYDLLYKSSYTIWKWKFQNHLVKNTRLVTIVSFLLIAGIEYAMICCGNYGYRALNIHIGAMFGTIMAFNVWFRIWPAQQKIIRAIKNGEAPDGNDVALAGLRSKHNTYMSIPLIWTMINQHTAVVNKGFLLKCDGLLLLIVIAVGWHIVFQLYKKSAKISSF